MRIKKGDTVKILYGKDKGKRGPVVAVDVKKEKVIVDQPTHKHGRFLPYYNKNTLIRKSSDIIIVSKSNK